MELTLFNPSGMLFPAALNRFRLPKEVVMLQVKEIMTRAVSYTDLRAHETT